MLEANQQAQQEALTLTSESHRRGYYCARMELSCDFVKSFFKWSFALVAIIRYSISIPDAYEWLQTPLNGSINLQMWDPKIFCWIQMPSNGSKRLQAPPKGL
eukprot:scaffold145712_cov21-Tisochrysis_lutea.AAC.2